MPKIVYYLTFMSPSQGVIINVNLIGRDRSEAAAQQWPSDVPYKWSDVVFNGWVSLCQSQNVDPSGLKYVFHQSVSNPTTLGVIDSLVDSDQSGFTSFQQWPGDSWDISEREAQTLLGSPNGYGLGFMLLQHRKALRNLKVQSVNVFKASGTGTELLFTLGQETNIGEPMAMDMGWMQPDGQGIPLSPKV